MDNVNTKYTLKGQGLDPLVIDIQQGAWNSRPIRSMIINYTPNVSLIDGLEETKLIPGLLFEYIDRDANKIDLLLEHISFGPLLKLSPGTSLIQFSIPNEENINKNQVVNSNINANNLHIGDTN